MAELLGSALQVSSSATALRAQCKTRLCGRDSPSTQEPAELTVLLKGWYLTKAWLRQAGIYHERLTRVKASVLGAVTWQVIEEHSKKCCFLQTLHIMAECSGAVFGLPEISQLYHAANSYRLVPTWLVIHARIQEMWSIVLHGNCVSAVLPSTMQAWLTANVQGFPVLHHLYRRFCGSEQPASATCHLAEPGSLPAAAAAAALAHADPAKHPATGSDVAASRPLFIPESHALQPSRPCVKLLTCLPECVPVYSSYRSRLLAENTVIYSMWYDSMEMSCDCSMV